MSETLGRSSKRRLVNIVLDVTIDRTHEVIKVTSKYSLLSSIADQKTCTEVTNWANWRIRRWRIRRTEMYTKDRKCAGTDEKV